MTASASHLLRTAALLLVAGCGPGWGGGTKWVEQPLVDDERSGSGITAEGTEGSPVPQARSRTLGETKTRNPAVLAGHSLGTFRNTYYDFPREGDYDGPTAALMSASCQPIATVPRSFHDAICVQGSGSLKSGGTVSFAKRDCACADVCPRTGQRICFEALDKRAFPWGRGAAGTPITPMHTLAADTAVLPMGTVVYLPELDGASSGEAGEALPDAREGGPHDSRVLDGCFIVEDRGLRVKGEHVDIFTGNASYTKVLEDRVPSNHGVTVVLDAPRCGYLRSMSH